MGVIKKLSFLFFLGLMFFVMPHLQAQKITIPEYIEKYKDIAIREMNIYKIPASITLAQGILESASGNSPLAKNANNHFGIKCNKDWTGETYHQDDDAANECFRKYDNPEQSFIDHSEFLAKRDRYAELFKLEITDYKGWAYGLKKAGYATNPKYPELLINLIEENNLAQYDKLYNPQSIDKDSMLLVASVAPVMPDVSNLQNTISNSDSYNTSYNDNVERSDWDMNVNVVLGSDYIKQNNGINYVIARKNDSWLLLAEKHNLMLFEILKYNDADKNTTLRKGEIVYIEPKKNKGSQDEYIVEKPYESIRDVSQKFGIKMKKLMKRNNLKTNRPLVKGERIRLR